MTSALPSSRIMAAELGRGRAASATRRRDRASTGSGRSRDARRAPAAPAGRHRARRCISASAVGGCSASAREQRAVAQALARGGDDVARRALPGSACTSRPPAMAMSLAPFRGGWRVQDRVAGERAVDLLALGQIVLDVVVNLAGRDRVSPLKLSRSPRSRTTWTMPPRPTAGARLSRPDGPAGRADRRAAAAAAPPGCAGRRAR